MTLIAVLLKFLSSSEFISVTLVLIFLVRSFQPENIKKWQKTTVQIDRTYLPNTERKRSRNQWRCEMLSWNFLQNDIWTLHKTPGTFRSVFIGFPVGFNPRDVHTPCFEQDSQNEPKMT
jgi:hypothetical protein